MRIKTSRKNIALISLLIIGLLGILSALILKLNSNCFHATDFGIYQEAIYKIAQLGDFNPYLYTRKVNIFNDHFDPIILLAAGFIKIFGQKGSNLIIFEYLFFLGIFAYIFSIKNLRLEQKLYFSFCILFTKGLLSGLNFPIHPTTWSMFPCFLLPFLIKRNRTH